MEYDPTGVDTYLLSPNFNKSLRNCPRTKLPVSFADFGDAKGQPVLFIPPEICSRWYAASLDMLCRNHGIRMICVDRPGCGIVPHVLLASRIDMGCMIILSVLDHLKVHPRHLISAGSGIFYTLHLMTHYTESFPIRPNPIFISPWVPLRVGNPPVLVLAIEAHCGVAKISEFPYDRVRPDLWDLPQTWRDPGITTSYRAQVTIHRVSAYKIRRSQSRERRSTADEVVRGGCTGMFLFTLPNGKPVEPKGLTEQAALTKIIEEVYQGIAEELAICNNKAGINTGSEWFKKSLATLALQLKAKKSAAQFDFWWATDDKHISQGRRDWLTEAFSAHREFTFKVHNVKGIASRELYTHGDGLRQIFAMIHFRERVYYGG